MTQYIAPVEAQHAGTRSFFSHHGLWAPGVRTFRAVRFRSKAVLISLAFLLPILVLGWQYFGDKHDAIAFSAKERVGVRYQRSALEVLDQLLAARMSAFSSGPTAKGDDRLTVAMHGLAEVHSQAGAGLDVSPEHADLAKAVQDLSNAPASDKARLAAFDKALQAAQALLVAVNDRSNLMLDPDLDTFYLMEAGLNVVPELMESVNAVTVLALVDAKGQMDMGPRMDQARHAARSGDRRVTTALGRVGTLHPEFVAALGYARVSSSIAAATASSGTAAGGTDHAPDALLGSLREARSRVVDQLDDLLARRVGHLQHARNLTAAALVGSLLLAAYLFLSFEKVLEGGLVEVARHIRAMRDGNLTTQPQPWGADEVAALMLDLMQMQQSLRSIVSEVRGASDGIVTAAREISAGSTDLSSRTEQSAGNLEQTAAAMTQLAASTQNNAAIMRQAAELAQTSATVAGDGGRVIGEMVQTMNGIREASSRISDIVGAIDGIAFQTNMLALNAAVEAARAGESGKGFAVVAAEVRALAHRSSHAAREIKGLIVRSGERVDDGMRVVTAAGGTMQSLVSNTDLVSSLLASVASEIDEQTRGVVETASSVQQLDRATQQNATLVEQSAAAATALDEQARALAGRVAQFVLPEDKVPP